MTVVHTQAQLDDATTNNATHIHITHTRHPIHIQPHHTPHPWTLTIGDGATVHITNTIARITGRAHVAAHDSCVLITTTAYRLQATGRSVVDASTGYGRIDARDDTIVTAHDRTVITAHDRTVITAHDRTVITAHGHAVISGDGPDVTILRASPDAIITGGTILDADQ
jgi:hypothetical protein